MTAVCIHHKKRVKRLLVELHEQNDCAVAQELWLTLHKHTIWLAAWHSG